VRSLNETETGIPRRILAVTVQKSSNNSSQRRRPAVTKPNSAVAERRWLVAQQRGLSLDIVEANDKLIVPFQFDRDSLGFDM
jgi:hypothetical protein